MGMSGTFPCLSLLLSLLNLEFDRRKAIKSTAPGREGVGGVVPLPIGTAAAEPCNPTPALTCGGVEEPGGGRGRDGAGNGAERYPQEVSAGSSEGLPLGAGGVSSGLGGSACGASPCQYCRLLSACFGAVGSPTGQPRSHRTAALTPFSWASPPGSYAHCDPPPSPAAAAAAFGCPIPTDITALCKPLLCVGHITAWALLCDPKHQTPGAPPPPPHVLQERRDPLCRGPGGGAAVGTTLALRGGSFATQSAA